MTAIERTAYPRLKSRYSPRELEQIFTPTAAELAFVKRTSPQTELGLLSQLKCLQYLGYFPTPTQIPVVIVTYLQQIIAQPAATVLYRWERTLYRHRAAIRRYLGIRVYDATGVAVARQAIQVAAQTKNDPADLINAALEELIHQL